jgi:hypothetical protein
MSTASFIGVHMLHGRYDALALPPRMQCVWLFVVISELMNLLYFLPAMRMDSDDELMVHQFLQAEAAAATYEEEHTTILLCLLQSLSMHIEI